MLKVFVRSGVVGTKALRDTAVLTYLIPDQNGIASRHVTHFVKLLLQHWLRGTDLTSGIHAVGLGSQGVTRNMRETTNLRAIITRPLSFLVVLGEGSLVDLHLALAGKLVRIRVEIHQVILIWLPRVLLFAAWSLDFLAVN